MIKNVLSKKKAKSLLVVMVMVLMLSTSVSVFADSDFDRINSMIMSESVKRGNAHLTVYKDLEEQISKVEDEYKRNALKLKLKAILDLYELDISNVSTQKPVEKPVEKPVDAKDYKHNALLTGYSDSTIRPDNYINREEAATLILRAKPDKDVSGFKSFKDLSRKRWSYDNIVNVNVSGYKDGTFRPTNEITRAEALTMINNNFNIDKHTKDDEVEFTMHFKDVKKHWAKDTIEKMSSAGIVAGYKDGSFKPDDKITRAEFITFINRAVRDNCVLDKSHEDYNSMLNLYLPEIGNHWAQDILIEALISHD